MNEWNEKTAEITGYSKEEAFNKPLGKKSSDLYGYANIRANM